MAPRDLKLRSKDGELITLNYEAAVNECGKIWHLSKIPNMDFTQEIKLKEVDAPNLRLIVEFIEARQAMREVLPDCCLTIEQRLELEKNDAIDQTENEEKNRLIIMQRNWVIAKFGGFSPTFSSVMTAAADLHVTSLVEAMSELIVYEMTDEYPEEINRKFGIVNDHDPMFRTKLEREYPWNFINIDNSMKQRKKREEEEKSLEDENSLVNDV